MILLCLVHMVYSFPSNSVREVVERSSDGRVDPDPEIIMNAVRKRLSVPGLVVHYRLQILVFQEARTNCSSVYTRIPNVSARISNISPLNRSLI